MKKALIFITLVLAFCQTAIAQDAPALPKQVKVGKPELLKPLNGTYKRSDLEAEFCSGGKWGTKKMVKEFWMVRSDRNRNPLYADATKSRMLNSTLSFNERVVIAEVKGDMALVYTDEKMEHYPDIPSYAKSRGWIPMENLLLWDQCPTDQRGVQYKALISINLNKVSGGNEFKGKVYMDPVSTREPRDLLMDMNFYFIMKETRDGKRVLLCQNPTVFGNNLYGWVDNTAFSRWDQRACLEPNWDQDYADSHKGQDVSVYADQQMSSGNKVTSWEFGRPNGDNDRWNQYRMAPNQLRFPIIESVSETANWIHCTSFADRQGKANIDASSRNVTKDVDRMRQMRGQMNIILVVEATTEMKEVFPAIKKSIDKFGSFSGQGLKVKTGAVFYRTSSQGASGIETVSLTNYDDPQLKSKFNAAKADGRLSAKDRDVALSLAIEKAADVSVMGFNKDHNNLMLVIGSRGAPDSDTRLTNPALLKKLADNNVQVMSIQVMQNQTGSWVNFNDQMIDLIKMNVNKQYAAIGDRADFKQRPAGDGYNFFSTKNKNNKDKSVLFAQIRYSKELGKALSANEITKYIDNGVNKFAQTTTTWSEHLEEALGDIQFDPQFLEKYLGKTGYERWKKIKAISAFDGYTKRKDSNGGDYWHYILYLSGDELRKLLDDLKPAYETAKSNADDRKTYVNAMKAIVKAHLGQSDDKGIDAMNPDQLQELIYGLDVHTEMTNRRNLKEIGDPKVVTAIEFRKMLSKFSENYERLDRLFKDGYTYRVLMGKDYYYWIPIEDLP